MRGRWASAAIGAGVARHRAQAEMDQQAQAAEQAKQQEIERLNASHQREIDQLKAAHAQPSQAQQASGQEDPIQKLKKLADLKQQGVLTEEEFQKLKAALIAKL
jgi:Short C-terminal domain